VGMFFKQVRLHSRACGSPSPSHLPKTPYPQPLSPPKCNPEYVRGEAANQARGLYLPSLRLFFYPQDLSCLLERHHQLHCLFYAKVKSSYSFYQGLSFSAPLRGLAGPNACVFCHPIN